MLIDVAFKLIKALSSYISQEDQKKISFLSHMVHLIVIHFKGDFYMHLLVGRLTYNEGDQSKQCVLFTRNDLVSYP